jgi:hypothetical protein
MEACCHADATGRDAGRRLRDGWAARRRHRQAMATERRGKVVEAAGFEPASEGTFS